MALPSITPDNFVGWVKVVANQFKQDDLDQYILTFREQYLREIVGDAAYTDIENQTRQKWTDLLDGVNYVDVDGERRRFNGLVRPLIQFIYFEFVRDNFTSTQVGRVKTKAENSERSLDLEVLNIARSRYNNGVLQVAALEDFLEANEEIEQEITGSVDNADNTYTLSVAGTKYLEDTDSLMIDSVEYQAVTVVSDTSILIDAGQTGLDFAGDTASWKPYEDVRLCILEPSSL